MRRGSSRRSSLKLGVINLDSSLHHVESGPGESNAERRASIGRQRSLRQSIIILDTEIAADIGIFETQLHTYRRQSLIDIQVEKLIREELVNDFQDSPSIIKPIKSALVPSPDLAAVDLAFKALNLAMQEMSVGHDRKAKLEDDASMTLLKNFMKSTGECLTWVETRELWSDMVKTNNGKMPSLRDSWNRLLNKYSPDDGGQPSADGLVQFARSIKDIYSIRLSDDYSELKFVLISQMALYLVVAGIAIAGYTTRDPDIGIFTWEIVVEAVSLFIAELIWETILSSLVFRFNMKINYTRKLGNLFKVPKYFVADLLPFYKSTTLSLFTSLALNQTLFSLLYYRTMRENVPFFSYVFLSQDRREDRPDTLTFQVTEDLMRFSIYFPFKIFVLNSIDAPAIIFIPILINSIGDGLAEPIGVKYGKHKYSTTAMYYKGKFWNGKFTRSYEGSFCVYITSVIVVAANYHAFSTMQFWLTVTILPFLMTIAEAKAPHTNDGPFLALFGCGFLTLMFFVVP